MALDTDDLCNSLVLNISVIDELFLHHGGVFEVGWLVTALVELVGLGGEGGHSVGLAELNFGLNTLDVAGITYR